MGIRGRTVVLRGIWSWYCKVAVKNSLPIIVHNLILSGILARGTDLPFLVLMMLVCEGRVSRQRLVASCVPSAAVCGDTIAGILEPQQYGTEWDR